MKILFAGTPDIAVPSLELLSSRFDIVAVLTAPDKSSGRGRKVVFSPVKEAALELNLKVLQPQRLGAEARKELAPLGADLLVVFAYGRIFGPKFLALFPKGGINMHPSALPRFRGPSPISAAILAGDSSTALSVQKISLGMDEGDILRQTTLALNGRETTGSLSERIALAAGPELATVIEALEKGDIPGWKQNPDEAGYCHIVKKEDGVIDWNHSAERIERMVRAYLPWPKARTTLRGESLALLETELFDTSASAPAGAPFGVSSSPPSNSAHIPGTVLGVDKSRGILIQTGRGILSVKRLQLASRKPLDFRSFLNGVPLQTGSILGDKNDF